MCGRYSLSANRQQLTETFTNFEFPDDLTPRYNIAPTQPVAAVANNSQGKVEFFQWGLIPTWAKDPTIGSRMINARAETLAEKPSFKTAYKRRRCLILADGFYEWRSVPKSDGQGQTKIPMRIHLASGQPFAFAGLWESWRTPDETMLLSCTIITTTPNELMATIHNRMPVILPRQAYEQWLDPSEQKSAQLQPLLKPYPAEEMTAYPVSTVVNNPRNDLPECIKPVEH